MVKVKQKVKRKSEKDPGAILLQDLKVSVKAANQLFVKRDVIALKHNKFGSKHTWKTRNPFKSKLDKVADSLTKVMEKIGKLETDLKKNEDYKLYLPMINTILSNYTLLKPTINADQTKVQHGTKGGKVNLARAKGRSRGNSRR